LARQQPHTGYPRCQLCVENVDYAGRLDFPARQTLRLVPLELVGERWYLQYSPYVYYNEHCIILSERHEPMVINRQTFAAILDFVRQFPHYSADPMPTCPLSAVQSSIITTSRADGPPSRWIVRRNG
jgi:UDPglucose--hexose-1-phosphate uridylyltransferase